MKLVAIFLAAVFVLGAARAEDVPKRPDFGRYQPMMTRSPFAVATAVVAPAATPDFAKDLFIANAAKSPDCDMVTIGSSSDRNFKKYITTCTPVEGYSIASIEWSDKVGATRVTINKDGKFATLTFNQALLTAPITNSVPQPGVQVQGQLPQPNVPMQQPTPVAIPNVPQPMPPRPMPLPPQPATNQPRVRGVIPRNPNTSVPPVPATPVPNQIVVPPESDDE